MRIKCGAVRITFNSGKVKHNQNGSAILYLEDKDRCWTGDLYLSPAEMKKLNTKQVRRIDNKAEGVGI